MLKRTIATVCDRVLTGVPREAKSFQHTLKDSLKAKDPWDRETDFTRKQYVYSTLHC